MGPADVPSNVHCVRGWDGLAAPAMLRHVPLLKTHTKSIANVGTRCTLEPICSFLLHPSRCYLALTGLFSAWIVCSSTRLAFNAVLGFDWTRPLPLCFRDYTLRFSLRFHLNLWKRFHAQRAAEPQSLPPM